MAFWPKLFLSGRHYNSRAKIELVLQIDDFHNDAFQWSHIVYYAAPSQEKFEDVTDQHLQGQAYATEQEILE